MNVADTDLYSTGENVPCVESGTVVADNDLYSTGEFHVLRVVQSLQIMVCYSTGENAPCVESGTVV